MADLKFMRAVRRGAEVELTTTADALVALLDAAHPEQESTDVT